jgi:hypothetical protein
LAEQGVILTIRDNTAQPQYIDRWLLLLSHVNVGSVAECSLVFSTMNSLEESYRNGKLHEELLLDSATLLVTMLKYLLLIFKDKPCYDAKTLVKLPWPTPESYKTLTIGIHCLSYLYRPTSTASILKKLKTTLVLTRSKQYNYPSISKIKEMLLVLLKRERAGMSVYNLHMAKIYASVKFDVNQENEKMFFATFSKKESLLKE